MTTQLLTLSAAVILSFSSFTTPPLKTLYDFSATTIDGKSFDFSTLKGKKVLIINTASKCGLTPQYEAMEQLYKTYGGKNFTIIGFPANNFGHQEPGNNIEIVEFCKKNYGVTFQMMSKISVKGNDIAPLYEWLTKKELNGVRDADVSWNFQKFMIDENGKWVDMVAPETKPNCDKIINWLEGK